MLRVLTLRRRNRARLAVYNSLDPYGRTQPVEWMSNKSNKNMRKVIATLSWDILCVRAALWAKAGSRHGHGHTAPGHACTRLCEKKPLPFLRRIPTRCDLWRAEDPPNCRPEADQPSHHSQRALRHHFRGLSYHTFRERTAC